ncbi:hypothetical protein Tco_0355482 [Tanacetum coccineum]
MSRFDGCGDKEKGMVISLGKEEEEEWGLGLLYNLTTVVFNPTLVPSTKLLLSIEHMQDEDNNKVYTEFLPLVAMRPKDDEVQGDLRCGCDVKGCVWSGSRKRNNQETMEQSRHLEYAVNFWYYKHGLLQMEVSSICIMLVCYRYYPYVGVFEIGITLGLESELRTARWSMILSRLSTVVELIQKLLQVSFIVHLK